MSVWDAVFSVFLARTPREIAGALIMATIAALMVSGVYVFLRRRFANNTMSLVLASTFVATLICMLAEAIYFQQVIHQNMEAAPPTAATPYRPARMFPAPNSDVSSTRRSTGQVIVLAADQDRDGRVSPEEAVQFFEQIDGADEGSVDAQGIDAALRQARGTLPRPGLPSVEHAL